MTTVLICYDISRDDTRARTAATLQIWGDRIQRSVFLCTLDPDDLVNLTARLRDLINPATDAVHIVPLCATCWTGIATLGQATIDFDQFYWAVL